MKKLSYLASCFLALLVTMFYAPTASATTGPPIALHADAVKTAKADQKALIVPTVATLKRLNQFRTRQCLARVDETQAVGVVVYQNAESHAAGYDYKDDPHIG